MAPLDLPSHILMLRGKAMVIIDWANVYGWQKTLNRRISPELLFGYFNTYPQIRDQYFYFGIDSHPKSKIFMSLVEKIGFIVRTKPVKYVRVKDGGYIRKCNLDLEIAIDVLTKINEYQTFIFLSGDGDFAVLYQRLMARGKIVILIFARGHLGRELLFLKKNFRLVNIRQLIKKEPPNSMKRGAKI